MYKNFKPYLISEIIKIKDSGLYKKERIITSPQNSSINTNEDNSYPKKWEFRNTFYFTSAAYQIFFASGILLFIIAP